MQLFKRVLLSLFPDEIVAQTINPASMFISFISTKEFFSVINRKIVENYKLNLFDVTLDPFEFKIGFGEQQYIKPKDIDTYYSYCATANLNGYRFFSPANIANNLALITAIYVKDVFRAHPPEYYLNFLYTIFLLVFVFLARIKIFPHKDKEKNYNWFIEVLFSFYAFVFQQTNKSIDTAIIKTIKKDILNHIDVFLMLFAVYQAINTLFVHPHTTDKDIYSRLFYDELKHDTKKNMYTEFIEHYDTYTKEEHFSDKETKILQSILPADILLRYLFLDTDMFLITDTIISKVFNKHQLDYFITSFRKDASKLEEFLLTITDYRNFKKHFFSGVQKYMITMFRNHENTGLSKEELDDFMSSIGEDIENIESFKIPERIKKESKMMEKILNFYITLVGGLWVSRGDTFFLRLFRKPIIQSLTTIDENLDQKQYTLLYYGGLLYQYGKNVFFYKHTSDNVRAGKQKFLLPHKTDIKNIYSNIALLKSFDEASLATILQDINPKDIRIFIKNKKIIDLFKGYIGQEVSQMVKLSDKKFLESVYKEIADALSSKHFLKTIQTTLTEQDIYHIKESIYNIDFRIHKYCIRMMNEHHIIFKNAYSDSAILGFFGILRETLFGLLMYLVYLQSTSSSSSQIYEQLLIQLYIQDILHIDEFYTHKLTSIITTLQNNFHEIITHRIQIDDNKEYLKIGADNRLWFIQNKSYEDIKNIIISEDILRFKGFLKNITYYNKRFLMPQ